MSPRQPKMLLPQPAPSVPRASALPRRSWTLFCAVAIGAALTVTSCGSTDDAAPTTAQSPSPTTTVTSESPQASPSPTQSPTPGDHAATSPAATDQRTNTPAATADAGDGSTSDTPSAQPTTTPPPGALPGGAVAAVENCNTNALSGSVTPQQAATGSVVLDVTLTNNGHQACKLVGFPGVSFVDADGAMIGVPAERTGAGGAGVTVLPGESASASLKLSNAADYGQVCNAHTSDALMIYPPENTAALTIPYQAQACGNPKISQLEIKGFGV